jgi:hypothetical protein
MKYTNLAIAAAFLMPTVVSANVRGEDHDLQPYLHHNLRNLKGTMKDGMLGSRVPKVAKATKVVPRIKSPLTSNNFPSGRPKRGTGKLQWRAGTVPNKRRNMLILHAINLRL